MSFEHGDDLIGSRVVRPRRDLIPKSRSVPPVSADENPRPSPPRRQNSKPELVPARSAVISSAECDQEDIIGKRWVSEDWDETKILRSKWAPPAPAPRISPNKSGTTTPNQYVNGAAAVSALDAPNHGVRTNAGQNDVKPKISTLRELDLERIRKLIARVSWKTQFLLHSQHMALTLPVPDPENRSSYLNPTTMFKLDFFEFYVLLERTLVQLLSFFHISVPKTKAEDGDTLRSKAFSAYGHSYHANVLAALDRRDNPLREILGAGDVRKHLETAKAFRNRWKDAENESEGHADAQAWREDIVKLSLEQMTGCIMDALEKGYLLCEEKEIGAKEAGSSPGDFLAAGPAIGDNHFEDDTMDLDDAPWEAVEDAMELEEVE
ncbi:uncharacterized protein IWZ02DRAFT_57593 [Phyllosticta citriasiana]|uniref:Uncharacterized protein n=1 Tax=Phyllosticta citriasiana TaxID=595635 RepID=A0ABR1L177_9PEZI